MYKQIELPDPDEELVVFFFRVPHVNQEKLFAADFVRRVHVRESGLSFLRPRLISYREMVTMTELRSKKQPRGLASCSARDLQQLNLKFWGDEDTLNGLAHICVHCVACNGQKLGCTSEILECPLSADGSAMLREKLASIMKIKFLPLETKKILDELGTDLLGETLEARNLAYLHRWSTLFKKPIAATEFLSIPDARSSGS